MTEFLHQDDIERVAGVEWRNCVDDLDALKVVAEWLKDDYDATRTIEPDRFQPILEQVNELLSHAENVMAVALRNGYPVEGFIGYLEKKVEDILEPINKYRAIIEAGGPALAVDALRLPLLVQLRLALQQKLMEDRRHGATAFDAHREAFRALKITPAAFFSTEIRRNLDAAAGAYPGLLDDQPPLAAQAELQEVRGGTKVDEVEALELLLASKVPNANVDWIRGNAQVLVRLLELTQVYEGNRVQRIGDLEGLRQLRQALQQVKDNTLALEQRAKYVPGTDIDAELNLFNLGGNRATGDHFQRIDELMAVIDLILDLENTPQYTVWRDQVIRNIELRSTIPTGEQYQDFLRRIETKLTGQIILEETEVRDLQRLAEHLERQEELIPLLNYPEETGANFNQQLHELQRRFIGQERARIAGLLQKDSELQPGASRNKREGMSVEIASGRQRIVQGIYERLTELNPNLPKYEDLRPIENPGTPEAHEKMHEFMQELLIALFKFFVDVFNKTASSGRTSKSLPSEFTSLWGKEKFKAAQGVEGDDTLEIFMRDFPWEQLMPGLTPTEKTAWIELWKMRVIHIEQMHNYAVSFRKDVVPVAQKPNEVETVLQLIRNRDNDGGLYSADLVPFYRRRTKPTGTISRYIGAEEKYWRVPEMVNFFIHWIEREVPNYSTGAPSTDDALAAAKVAIIDRIPEEYRIKDAQGAFRDENLIEVAWLVAIWRLYPTLRIFDMDDGAQAFKTSRLVNTGEVATKYTYGRANTAERWTDSGVQQLNRIWPPRSKFIHMYTELRPEVYEEYTLEELEQQLLNLRDRINNPTAHGVTGRHLPELKRRAKELEEFIIETKQLGVGEFQKIRGVQDVDVLAAEVARLNAAIDALTSSRPPQRVGEYELYQQAQLQELLQELQRVRRRSIAAGDTAEVTDSKLRSAAVRYGVRQRYRLLRIRPEYTTLKTTDPTATIRDVSEMVPIRVPVAYFDHAERMSQRSSNQVVGREHWVALSDDQIIRSGINPELVHYETVTPAHAPRWAAAAADMMAIWLDMLDGTKKDGAFTPIHDAHLESKISRKTKYLKFPDKLRMTAERLRALIINKPHQVARVASDLDQYLRSLVVITQLERDDFAVNMRFDKITKTGMRYAGPKWTVCGPKLAESDGIEEQMTTGELWAEMFRRLYRVEDADGHVETFTQLRAHVTAADELRKAKRTPVPSGIRLAADMFNLVDARGKRIFEKAAVNQMVVEAFIIAVAMYLDRYRYKSIEEGHGGIQFFGDQLEATRSQIHTVTDGVKPMDFAHRELFLQLCEAAFESFLSEDFGTEDTQGDQTGIESKIVREYTRQMVEQMMRDAGIIGSTEQYVVDMVYYENEFMKKKEVADAKKEEGAH